MQYVSNLNKQNFDLKLELYHRRQRTEALEAKLQKAEELEVRNEELQHINEDLLQELEKRDAAVEEAVSLICELEAKVEQLELHKTVNTISSSPRAGGAAEEKAQSTSQTSQGSQTNDSEERRPRSSNRQRSNSRNPIPYRTPSFLRDDKSSTSALRSLYRNGERFTANNPSLLSLRRPGSMFSQDEYQDTMDGDTFSLNPRRLSLLSESSFVSVYGKKESAALSREGGLDDTSLDKAKDGLPQGQSLQEGRVQEWVESRNQPSTPSKKSTSRSSKNEALSSIGEVLHASPLKPTREIVSYQTDPMDRSPRRDGVASRSVKQGWESAPSYGSSLAGPIFGSGMLPPTPGTMSTATLGEKSSSHSIVAEKSSADGLSLPANGYASSIRRSPEGKAHSPKIDIMKYARSAIPDSDTDIDVSDAELEPAQLDRPAALSYGTNMMFNGEGLDSIRPARTVSPRDRHKSPQNLSKTTSNTRPTPDKPKKDVGSSGGNKDAGAELGMSALKPPPKPLRHKHCLTSNFY